MRLIRNIGLSIGLIFALSGELAAQGCGTSNPNCIVVTAPPGTNNNQAASTAFVHNAVSGLGTVTSVGLSLPSALYIVSGSPVTTSGTLTATLQTQTANTIWAGPTTGAAAAPTFRALVAADLPGTVANAITALTGDVTATGPGSVTANLVAGVAKNTLNAQTANYSIQTTDCGKTVQAGTGSTGYFTVTLPSVSGFAATCVVTVKNGDTGRAKALSGFPSDLPTLVGSSPAIYWLGPQQTVQVGIVNGAWVTSYNPGRFKLGGTFNIYVDTGASGKDDGTTDGLSSSSAFLTNAHAYGVDKQMFDHGGGFATQANQVQASTTLTTTQTIGPGQLTGANGPSSFVFLGAGRTSTTITSSTNGVEIFNASNNAQFSVQSMTLTSSGTGGFCLVYGAASFVTWGDIKFNNCTAGAVDGAGAGAVSFPVSAYEFAGTHNFFGIVEDGAQMFLGVANITLTSTPVCSSSCYQADLSAVIDFTPAPTVTGTATGKKYNVSQNGWINSNAFVFPGTVAGTISSGGGIDNTWSGAGVAGSDTQVQFNSSGSFGASANLTWVSPALTVGLTGTAGGQLKLAGSSTGTVTQTGQAAAGTPTVTWGTSSGTPAVTATSPLAISSTTGNITCTGCLTNSPAALTKTDDTNVTLTLGGTPATSLLQATSLTLGWTGTLGVSRGGTGLGSGTSGGILGYTASGTLASSGALTANALLLGGGAGATPSALGSLGTTTTLLHGNAAGAPTFGAVSLTADVTGNLPVTNLNSGTSASSSTFWRGDGTWATPAGSGVTPAALTKTDDTNVTLTLGGTPATALLQASSITAGWAGSLAASRGGFGADVSGSSGVPLFATGTATFTSTSGTGNFVRVTSPTLVTPVLGAATGTSLALGGATLGSNALAVTGHTLIEGVTSTGATGTGNFVFSASPTLSGNPILATPSATAAIVGSSTTFPSGDTFVVSNNATTLPAGTSVLAHFGGANSISPSILTDSFATNGTFVFRRANNTAASPSALAANDIVLNMSMLGYGATAYSAAAKAAFRFTAAEAWSDTAQGAYITLHTTPTTTTTLAEAVRVQASGGISIGTTTDPGIGSLQINAQQFNPNMTADTGIADSTVCTATTGGKLLKGTGTLGICLGTSSAKFKNHIVPVQDGLAKIDSLLPVNFMYNKDAGDNGARLQYGFLAEDMNNVLPRLVHLDAQNKPLSVDLLGLVPVMVKAMQELKADNDNLRLEINQLKKANAK